MTPVQDYGLRQVHVDPEVADTPMAARIRERLPEALFLEGPPPGAPASKDAAAATPVLHVKRHRGAFLRFCPGTRRYNCCGYRIVHVGENCPLDCAYCILQAYFQTPLLTVFANQGEMFEELGRAFGASPGARFRVGTGEFTDSLVLESLTSAAQDLVGFLVDFPNVRLELKSKVVDLSWLAAARRPEQVLPAWSLNAPGIAARWERGAATLEERLAAARECAALGFRVCLHFDPIIRFPGWERGYAETVDMIFDYVRPEDIAYFSLGSFRFMDPLGEVIRRRFPEVDWIHGEFVVGRDGKRRLLRPLRGPGALSVHGVGRGMAGGAGPYARGVRRAGQGAGRAGLRAGMSCRAGPGRLRRQPSAGFSNRLGNAPEASTPAQSSCQGDRMRIDMLARGAALAGV